MDKEFMRMKDTDRFSHLVGKKLLEHNDVEGFFCL